MKINPLDENNLQIHTILNIWGNQLTQKSEAMKESLRKSNLINQIEILDLILSKFLFKDYKSYFTKLIPPSDP